MRFWDASAVVAVAAGERERTRLEGLLTPTMCVWWGTPVEVASAIARKERDGEFTPAQTTLVFDRLRQLAAHWVEVEPVDRVRRVAQRLVRVHPLRAADALQLAAALVVAGDDPSTMEFVCLDARLASMATREGLAVLA